ncbi:SRPBCC domain-containing protein [Paenibacillus albicereus]|uniref:SRPBCC domain-containing protein n=1 Tax=Paenibacillus albicereus TaxID=2726185 RepID=A0A6H2GTT4_9BACL|nr:SRPBCC domain-containing protein [Paenibacillus albicereus]QJC50820.1 SRPBCC domain-containing protein [Paenibacillus albicereus]
MSRSEPFDPSSKASGRPLPEIRQVQVLRAPIEKVWEAAATSQGIEAWFMPNTFVAEEGAEFILHAGPFGDSRCRVTELSPPHRLRFDWGEQWSVAFELKELEPGVTEFTLVHGGWSKEGVTEFGQAHREVRERMNGGWAGIVKKLAAVLEA